MYVEKCHDELILESNFFIHYLLVLYQNDKYAETGMVNMLKETNLVSPKPVSTKIFNTFMSSLGKIFKNELR